MDVFMMMLGSCTVLVAEGILQTPLVIEHLVHNAFVQESL
jgi:hypothetical protein